MYFDELLKEIEEVVLVNTIDTLEDDSELTTEEDWLNAADGQVDREIGYLLENIEGNLDCRHIMKELLKHIAERFDDGDLGLRIAEEENDDRERRYNEMLAGEE